MAKKKHEPDDAPNANDANAAGAFLDSLAEVRDTALRHTVAQTAAKDAHGTHEGSLPAFTEEELDHLIQQAECHFPWLRYRDKLSAESFITDECYESFEDDMDPERFAAFKRKELPTPDELARFNQLRYDRLMADGGHGIDLDITPMCSLTYHTLANGQKKVLMTCGMGYSFSSVRHWLEGVFDTEEELWAYVKAAWTNE